MSFAVQDHFASSWRLLFFGLALLSFDLLDFPFKNVDNFLFVADKVNDLLFIHLDLCLKDSSAKIEVLVCLDVFDDFTVKIIDFCKFAFLLFEQFLHLF